MTETDVFALTRTQSDLGLEFALPEDRATSVRDDEAGSRKRRLTEMAVIFVPEATEISVTVSFNSMLAVRVEEDALGTSQPKVAA